MAVPILTVNELVKQFPRHHLPPHVVLQQVSFTVSEGEIVGLIGESGSGKTTLARIIAGLAVPDSGTVHWHSLAASSRPGQMIFQNPYASLYRRMTICEIIQEPLILQNTVTDARLRKQAVKDALQQVLLPDSDEFLNRYPHQLSGGQRQRVAIARALAAKPQLLIADEATSMLDVSVQMEIIDLLLALNRHNGLSILFITHNLALAVYACHRLLVLQEGQLIEHGTPARIINHCQHPGTEKLVQSARNLYDHLLHHIIPGP